MAGNAPPEFQPCFLPVYAEPLKMLLLCGRVGVADQYEHVQTAPVKDAHPSFGHFSLLQESTGFGNEFCVVCFVESLGRFFCQFRHLCQTGQGILLNFVLLPGFVPHQIKTSLEHDCQHIKAFFAVVAFLEHRLHLVCHAVVSVL